VSAGIFQVAVIFELAIKSLFHSYNVLGSLSVKIVITCLPLSSELPETFPDFLNYFWDELPENHFDS